jgi:hypothetical protein
MQDIIHCLWYVVLKVCGSVLLEDVPTTLPRVAINDKIILDAATFKKEGADTCAFLPEAGAII